MLFGLLQPKAAQRRPKQTNKLGVEELPQRVLLSDIGTGNPDPFPPPPPPPPPPAETGGGG